MAAGSALGLSISGITGDEIRSLVHRELARSWRPERILTASGLPADPAGLRRLKALGFSDQRLAQLTGKTDAAVAAEREQLGVLPVYKRIDTCAAEFASATPYMYSTYEAGYGPPVCRV